MSYTIYPDVLFVTNLVMDFLLLRLVKKLCRGKAGVFASLGGAAFGAFGYMSADPLTCQPSGEYDTGICGNQHDHGKVRMRTADDKRTLRRSRGAVHSRISHGRHDGSPEALPWTGQNVGSAARGNRLLPCVCCCIFPVYAVEKKGKDPLSGEIADGRAQDRSGCFLIRQRPV